MRIFLCHVFISLVAFGKCPQVAAEEFVYEKDNKFNYSYPGGNWSYVPCVNGYYGSATCDTLTGNLRTTCVDVDGRKTCVCFSGFGFKTPNCTENDTSPKCVSSSLACSDLTGKTYMGLGFTFFGMLFLIVGSAQALLALFTTLSLQFEFTAKVSTLLFSTLALLAGITNNVVSIFITTFKDVSYFMVIVWGISAGVYTVCLFAAMFNICAVCYFFILFNVLSDSFPRYGLKSLRPFSACNRTVAIM